MIWCLHGTLGTPQDWNVLSTALVKEGHIVRKVDLWKYLECRSVGLEEFGAVFCEEVKAQDEEPILIGYSMGARLGIHALLEDPPLWKQSIFLSPHLGLHDSERRTQRRAHDAEWAAKVMSLPWTEFLREWNGQSVLGEPMGLPDRLPLERRKNAIARSFVAWSLGMQEDLSTDFLQCSSTVITGQQDAKFTALWNAWESETIQRYAIPDAGHRVLWDRPEEVIALISSLVS